MDLVDIPVGPFVYIVPTEGKKERDVQKTVKESVEKKVEKKESGHHHHQNSHRHRAPRKRSVRSSTVYSDTALYTNSKAAEAIRQRGLN
ncbi:hypothetical protein L1049_004959 [Liquidambar formosana]|uniref:Uncharacterized protein n=1 Tax=Liquidambar formosana TaxID=63359 RepID=A0AAP0RTH8_LIQFO